MIEKIIRKTIHHLGNILRAFYIFYLKLSGVKIGKNTMISLRAKIDVRRGKVIIGNNCTITYGCIILSHDHAAALLHPSEKSEGKTIINDDVFIGVNSIILPKVNIGQNSIIGAGSIVSHDIPPNVVAMGNPARIIREIKK